MNNFDISIIDIKKMLARLGMKDDYESDLSIISNFIRKCEYHNYEISVEIIQYEIEYFEQD